MKIEELIRISEREWRSINTKIMTLNDRTKLHTLDIRELKKRIKLLEDKK